MTILIALGSVAAYLAGAVFGWRLGYVRGYEAARRRWKALGHNSAHTDGIFYGALAGVFWPIALPLFLVGARLTPTPPTRRAELLDERERKLRDLEREAGIR